MKAHRTKSATEQPQNWCLLFIPCSCGASLAVAEDYDRRGVHIRSFIPCQNCGKRHDPRNRLLRIEYQKGRFWKVSGC